MNVPVQTVKHALKLDLVDEISCQRKTLKIETRCIKLNNSKK